MMTRGDFWGRYLKYYMARKAKRNKATSKFKRLQQNLAADSAAIVADMGGEDAAGDEAQQLEGKRKVLVLWWTHLLAQFGAAIAVTAGSCGVRLDMHAQGNASIINCQVCFRWTHAVPMVCYVSQCCSPPLRLATHWMLTPARH